MSGGGLSADRDEKPQAVAAGRRRPPPAAGGRSCIFCVRKGCVGLGDWGHPSSLVVLHCHIGAMSIKQLVVSGALLCLQSAIRPMVCPTLNDSGARVYFSCRGPLPLVQGGRTPQSSPKTPGKFLIDSLIDSMIDWPRSGQEYFLKAFDWQAAKRPGCV